MKKYHCIFITYKYCPHEPEGSLLTQEQIREDLQVKWSLVLGYVGCGNLGF